MNDSPTADTAAAPRPWPYATPADAPAPHLDVADNPEIGRLYGPDGRLAKIVRAKPDRVVGFQPRQPQEWTDRSAWQCRADDEEPR